MRRTFVNVSKRVTQRRCTLLYHPHHSLCIGHPFVHARCFMLGDFEPTKTEVAFDIRKPIKFVYEIMQWISIESIGIPGVH